MTKQDYRESLLRMSEKLIARAEELKAIGNLIISPATLALSETALIMAKEANRIGEELINE